MSLKDRKCHTLNNEQTFLIDLRCEPIMFIGSTDMIKNNYRGKKIENDNRVLKLVNYSHVLIF